MKKEERLHRLMGDIDDDLVAGASANPIPLRVWLPRVTAAVAAVALTVGVVLTLPWTSEKPSVSDGGTTVTTAPQGDENANTPPIEYDPGFKGPTNVAPPLSGGATTTAANSVEIWYEPRWDEKTVWQKYPDFERIIPEGYNGKMNYTVQPVQIEAALVEAYLEDVNLHGYDPYTDTSYAVMGKIYRIKGINDVCAVALQYPGEDDYYPAVNAPYSPATLGQFMADLNLRQTLTIGKVYGEYRDDEGYMHTVEYEGLTVEKVWELVMQNADLPNLNDWYVGKVPEGPTEHDLNEADWAIELAAAMDISVSIPVLGIHNVSMRITPRGYLVTNLLKTEKRFYIGADAAAALMDYVHNHCRLVDDRYAFGSPEDTKTDTTAHNDTTMTSPAQPPLVTGTTARKPAPAD